MAQQTVTIEFKKFGVSLDVTPTIIDADHLNLRIRSEVSQLSNTGAIVPLSVNATVTISGLDDAARGNHCRTGQRPELRARRPAAEHRRRRTSRRCRGSATSRSSASCSAPSSFQRNETELVIIVTPYLVKPAPTVARLRLPTDGLVVPHDAQQIIHGGLYRQQLPAPPKGPMAPVGAGLVGPVGFRLD